MNVNYLEMFNQAQVDQTKILEIGNVINKILPNQIRYQSVSVVSKVPWYVIAAIHNLEASLNFNSNLANGDPLSARTVHVPQGRPVKGTPPFSWEFAAEDVLMNSNLWFPENWNVSNCLEFMERYNGFGYLARGINTPYLWSFTSLYMKGLFISDGAFDPNAVSQEIGAVALFKVMENQGIIDLQLN